MIKGLSTTEAKPAGAFLMECSLYTMYVKRAVGSFRFLLCVNGNWCYMSYIKDDQTVKVNVTSTS